MNNERYNQIIGNVYKSYYNKAKKITTEELFNRKISGVGEIIHGMLEPGTRDFRPYTQEEFINKIKTDSEFAKKWGLKVEERELSYEERCKITIGKDLSHNELSNSDRYKIDYMYEHNIPTKSITIEYDNEKVEIYE